MSPHFYREPTVWTCLKMKRGEKLWDKERWRRSLVGLATSENLDWLMDWKREYVMHTYLGIYTTAICFLTTRCCLTAHIGPLSGKPKQLDYLNLVWLVFLAVSWEIRRKTRRRKAIERKRRIGEFIISAVLSLISISAWLPRWPLGPACALAHASTYVRAENRGVSRRRD